jgi:CO/xanthine dehydrogenase Mo-binding subunit
VFYGGQLFNAGLIDYAVPPMETLPDEFASILLEDGDGPGPCGAKSVGESGSRRAGTGDCRGPVCRTGVWVTCP